VISPRILLACAGALAALAALPVAYASASSSSPSGLDVRTEGVAVATSGLRPGVASNTTVVVPEGAAALSAETTGSPAVVRHVRITVVRASDGATLFVGSLGSFSRLPVAAGEKLRVRVVRTPGADGLTGSATLAWA
jgi:hypothetical protein